MTPEDLKRRSELRLRVLHALFDMVEGQSRKSLSYQSFLHEMCKREHAASRQLVHDAALYMADEGLIEIDRNTEVRMSHKGVVEVERIRKVVPGLPSHFVHETIVSVTNHYHRLSIGVIQSDGVGNVAGTTQLFDSKED